jgi:anaerobic carbon-monoxide dehydrogenase iron sulfur subunit
MEEGMSKKIIVDPDKCTGCLMCGQACSLQKTGYFNPSAARIRVVDWEDTGSCVPVVCQHCAEPVCLAACPVGAISQDPQTGIVGIDTDTCTNCSTCRQVCPFAGPLFSPTEKRVVLCDHCGGQPACVGVCPTEALQYGECRIGHADQRLAAMGEIRKTLIKKERRQ